MLYFATNVFRLIGGIAFNRDQSFLRIEPVHFEAIGSNVCYEKLAAN